MAFSSSVQDLLSEGERFVPPRERNSAIGARPLRTSEIVCLFLRLHREQWVAQAELRLGTLDWTECEKGQNLRLR